MSAGSSLVRQSHKSRQSTRLTSCFTQVLSMCYYSTTLSASSDLRSTGGQALTILVRPWKASVPRDIWNKLATTMVIRGPFCKRELTSIVFLCLRTSPLRSTQQEHHPGPPTKVCCPCTMNGAQATAVWRPWVAPLHRSINFKRRLPCPHPSQRNYW